MRAFTAAWSVSNVKLQGIYMRRVILLALAGVLAVATSMVAQQQQPADPIKAVSDALGASDVKTLKFTGFGANFSVGQSPSPTEPWPRVTVKSYAATIDYEAQAMRVEMTREQGPIPPRGGGVPFVGEQRTIQVVRGNTAWNEQPPPAPAGGRGRRGGGPPPAAVEAGRVTQQEALSLVGVRPPGPPPPTPAPAAVVDRMVQIYLTPHGFLKGAIANKATARKVGNNTEITFTANGKYKFVGVANSRNEIEKITTWTDSPVLGDMPLEVTYSNYQKFDESGVSFPLRIVQTQGGFPSLDLWVSSVLINPTGTTLQDPRNAPADAVNLNFDVPDVAKNATIPAPTVVAQEIGKGIQYLTGGTHHSVAIEMKDHIILVEAPLNEARSNAVVAKVKELFPTKPIKYVINTHAHFDHSGGLRTLVADGATIVTHQSNRPYYEKAWMAPHTIEPDKLAQNKKLATFVTFTNKQVLTDGARTVEIHRIAGNPHNDAFAMVYLPAEKILIEADAYTPPAPPAPAQGGAPGGAAGGRAGAGPAGAAPEGGARAAGAGGRGAAAAAPTEPPPPSPSTVNLYENIQKLKLDVAQIAPLHGNRLATMDDLKQASTPAQPAGTGQ